MLWPDVADDDEVGTAVVGAGVGGCYTAFRIASARGHASARLRPVTLYERSHRSGGRIWSARLSSPHDDAWAELGAMRLHREAGPVMGLLNHLGLTRVLVPFTFGCDENLTYLRGTLLRQHRLGDAGCRVPYRLRDTERGYHPDALVLRAVEASLPGFTRLRANWHRTVGQGRQDEACAHLVAYRSLRQAATVSGKPLRRVPWPALLAAALSPEAVRYVEDADGYDHHGGNAADWIDVLFHTPPEPRYVTMSGGMQQLPGTLHTSFDAAGGHTRLGHRLLRVERDSARTGGYRLTFALQDRADRDTGTRVTAHAHTVVLALPQGALRRLNAGLLRDPRLRRDVDAVEAIPALKLFLAYDRPWWRDRGVSSGRSTTDTSLRQLWYGGTCPPADTGGPALLLAAYPNGPSAARWTRLRDGPRHRPPAAPDATFTDATFTDAPVPSAAMVEHAHALLTAMHGVRGGPPLSACWQDWSRPPHDGAWHVWRPGRSSHAVAARMRAPLRGEAVHVVSDCWTSDPGSIPGVLDCAERVLQDHLGLAPPPWRRTSSP